MSKILQILSDQELVHKLQADDERALELIYKRYAQELYYTAYRLLGQKEICEDLIHDLFVDLWIKREKHHITVLKPYLYTAIKNRVLMHLRQSKITIDISAIEILDQQSSDSFIIQKELTELSLNTVSNLPEKCREIYQLSRYEQHSHKEIAALKGISTKTVENQISIALKRLKPAFKDYITILLLLSLWLTK